MEELCKSAILEKIRYSMNHQKDLNGSWVWVEKGSRKVVKIKMTVTPQETFTDENGVKWIRWE